MNQPLVNNSVIPNNNNNPRPSKSLRDLKYFRHLVEHTLHDVEEAINLQVRTEEEAVQDAFDNLLIRL